MCDSNDKFSKLDTIKQHIIFPSERDGGGLPYIGKGIAACTSVIKDAASHRNIEESVERILTDAQQINWCRTIHPLHPLKTSGRGNQFLSALSVELWGFTDGANILHRLLYVFISEFAKDLLFDRFVQKNETSCQTIESNFKRFTEMTKHCSDGGNDAFAEGRQDLFPMPLHIFAVSNVLRRSIVILGDEEDDRTGLYLPVLWKAEDCIKWPLVLALHDDLYFPLLVQEVSVTESKVAEFAVPLVSSNLNPTKMKFLLEAEETQAHSLLLNYLNVMDLNLTRSSGICLILSAKLNCIPFNNDRVVASGVAGSQVTENLVLNQTATGSAAIPSAPSASIVTLNILSEAQLLPEEEREISMLQVTCCYPGCNLFVSKYTEPFCWEHVEHKDRVQNRTQATRPTEEHVDISFVNERCREPRCKNFASRFIYPYCYEHLDRRTVECMVTKPFANQLPAGSSIVMEQCQHGSCKNYASQYIYPFCYEHIDDRELVGTAHPVTQSGGSRSSQDYDVSIMPESCIHPNCHNHASVHTFPVCYEHLDSPLAAGRAAAATSIVQLPRPGHVRRVRNKDQPSASSHATQNTLPIDKKFEETMKELEARSKTSVTTCRKAGCRNFGNSRCRGYCHSCYSTLQQ